MKGDSKGVGGGGSVVTLTRVTQKELHSIQYLTLALKALDTINEKAELFAAGNGTQEDLHIALYNLVKVGEVFYKYDEGNTRSKLSDYCHQFLSDQGLDVAIDNLASIRNLLSHNIDEKTGVVTDVVSQEQVMARLLSGEINGGLRSFTDRLRSVQAGYISNVCRVASEMGFSKEFYRKVNVAVGYMEELGVDVSSLSQISNQLSHTKSVDITEEMKENFKAQLELCASQFASKSAASSSSSMKVNFNSVIGDLSRASPPSSSSAAVHNIEDDVAVIKSRIPMVTSDSDSARWNVIALDRMDSACDEVNHLPSLTKARNKVVHSFSDNASFHIGVAIEEIYTKVGLSRSEVSTEAVSQSNNKKQKTEMAEDIRSRVEDIVSDGALKNISVASVDKGSEDYDKSKNAPTTPGGKQDEKSNKR